MDRWVSDARPLPDQPNARTGLLDEFPDLLQSTSDDFLENLLSVYSSVLQAEKAANACPQDLVRSRLVGYFILYAPTLQALKAIADELRSVQRSTADSESFNSACYRLGDELLQQFVRPFRERRCRQSIDYCEEEEAPIPEKLSVAEALECAPQNAIIARLTALTRDCFRCEVTGAFDWRNVMFNPNGLARKYHDEEFPNAPLKMLDAHHLIPDFDCDTSGWHDGWDNQGQPLRSEAQWKFWERFGHPELRGELAGKIHRLENIVTLRSDICEMADDLRYCLKPVHGKYGVFDNVMFGPNPDMYKRLHECLGRRIFMVNSAADIPHPKIKYFRIQATCCFIANMSGAIEYNDFETLTTRLVPWSGAET
ncbi:hypothetical protein L226DRAFT_614475 [Lentinus tigrinus ALCF2SS1-7]|uniref:HNH nuclease domain-containing protein n=1 Tax=Lentinus tigrinus ALCF2SS1-6 TaxID=1328759 RepID=A0A5C2S3U3_9APHY|nr:hypothetical protein L227DRAFT_613045 [Lentinus tigrinus ALCF2SS1-6]RPD72899.1 hypothetical protein L226DRAFT_614475 [Lentinus tigrinus ALCF2SS1-7]